MDISKDPDVFCLKENTGKEWVSLALSHLNAILVDHAHCEHKAAITALSFVSKYPDDSVLVSRLAALAEEEAGHFRIMVEVCLERGLELGHPGPDPYVRVLLEQTRKDGWMHREDRLLICALIEARSCERLKLLAEHVMDPDLRILYETFWKAEVLHYGVFLDLAVRTRQRALDANEADARRDTEERLDVLAQHEAETVRRLPVRPAIH